MITSFHHVGCLVHNIETAVADYRVLHPTGQLSDRYTIAGQGVYVQFFSIGETRIEFVQPFEDNEPLQRLLKKNAGYYHIAVCTDDLDAEIARLEQAGYRAVNKFRSAAFDGRYCAFLYNRELHLIELIEKEPAH